MNKDTIKKNKESVSFNADSEIITSCWINNTDKLTRCITSYQNIVDNSVLITELGVSVTAYIQQMTNGNLNRNIIDYESNIINIKKSFIDLKDKRNLKN